MVKINDRIKLLLVIIICIFLTQVTFAQLPTATVTDLPNNSDNNLQYLQGVMNMIKEKYDGEIDNAKLIEAALKGMFGNLDEYSQYFTAEEANGFFDELNGTSEDECPVTFEIRGDIGYIKLANFGTDSSSYITKALDEMDKKNIKKLILDIRNNTGGSIEQGVLIAQNFVPKGLITKLIYKSDKIKDVEYFSYLDKPKYKLVILINGMSASTSEILAAAIQDTGTGKLVGTKTYGKARIQSVVQLLSPNAHDKYSKQLGIPIIDSSDLAKYNITPNENEIEGYAKITVGMYTTPKGQIIDQKGLTPDFFIEDPVTPEDIDGIRVEKLSKESTIKLGEECIDVLMAEKILTLSGYTLGISDLKFDDKTFLALKEFQKDNNLPQSGLLDLETQDFLNNELDNLYISMDTQYAKAIEILN